MNLRKKTQISLATILKTEVLVTDQTTEEKEESQRDLESALIEDCQVTIECELQEKENDNADGNDRQGILPSAKIFIPEIKGHMYKAKVVTELFTHGKVSSDRLIGVTQAGTIPRSVGLSSSSVSLSNGQNKTVGLFGFVAVRNDADAEYFLGRVPRICRSYQTHRGSKRRVEYIRPVNIEDLSQDIKIRVNVMESDDRIHKLSDVIVDCPIRNILFSVELIKVENVYSLNAIDSP